MALVTEPKRSDRASSWKASSVSLDNFWRVYETKTSSQLDFKPCDPLDFYMLRNWPAWWLTECSSPFSKWTLFASCYEIGDETRFLYLICIVEKNRWIPEIIRVSIRDRNLWNPGTMENYLIWPFSSWEFQQLASPAPLLSSFNTLESAAINCKINLLYCKRSKGRVAWMDCLNSDSF